MHKDTLDFEMLKKEISIQPKLSMQIKTTNKILELLWLNKESDLDFKKELLLLNSFLAENQFQKVEELLNEILIQLQDAQKLLSSQLNKKLCLRSILNLKEKIKVGGDLVKLYDILTLLTDVLNTFNINNTTSAHAIEELKSSIDSMEPIEELIKNNSKRIATENSLIQNLINLNALKIKDFKKFDNNNKCEELTSKQNYRIEELENKIKKLNENPGLDINGLFDIPEDSSAENITLNRIIKVSLIIFPFLVWVISFYYNYQESKNINEIFLLSYSRPDSLLLSTDFIRISGLQTNDIGSNVDKHSTSSPNTTDTLRVNRNSLIQSKLLNNRSSINADFNLNGLKLLDNQLSRFQSRNFINYSFYYFVYLVLIAFIWLDNKRERYRQNYKNRINALVHILNSINSSNTLITRSEYRKLWDQVSSQYLSEKYNEPSIIDFVKNFRKS